MSRNRADRVRAAAAGFTLIELLVVIAIIALLVGILLPSLGAARESARKIVCQSNQRQIYLAMSMYSDDYQRLVGTPVNGGGRIRPGDGTQIQLVFPKNGTQFFFNPADGKDFAPPLEGGDDGYWGLHYDEYLGDLDVWQCPSFEIVDPYVALNEDASLAEQWGLSDTVREEYFRRQTYGLNGYGSDLSPAHFADERLESQYTLWEINELSLFHPFGGLKWIENPGGRSLEDVKFPKQLFLFHDAYEHKLEIASNLGNSTAGDGYNQLHQYDNANVPAFVQQTYKNEYFRHQNKGVVTAADGSIEEVDRSETPGGTDASQQNVELLNRYRGSYEPVGG